MVAGTHMPCLTIGVYACPAGADVTNLLVSKKVDLVLNGHEHMYQRTKQLALGTGCTALVGALPLIGALRLAESLRRLGLLVRPGTLRAWLTPISVSTAGSWI